MSHSDAWFPCYTADLLGSMRWKMMTPEQRGAYWQLICWQMQSDDGHLSADVAQLSRLADVDLSGANACVMDAFPMNGNGRRANPRALKEWEKRQAISGKRSAAGTKGMASRYHKARQPDNKPITSVTTSTSTSTGEQPEPLGESRKRPPKLSDEEWMAQMRATFGAMKIDVAREESKCRAWCTTKGQNFSRGRFLNWLNRASENNGSISANSPKRQMIPSELIPL
jgi:hypothetical protein